jgi:hypothetical protein
LGGERSASLGIVASRSGDVENGDVASLDGIDAGGA